MLAMAMPVMLLARLLVVCGHGRVRPVPPRILSPEGWRDGALVIRIRRGRCRGGDGGCACHLNVARHVAVWELVPGSCCGCVAIAFLCVCDRGVIRHDGLRARDILHLLLPMTLLRLALRLERRDAIF
jgi:hypothetical protein